MIIVLLLSIVLLFYWLLVLYLLGLCICIVNGGGLVGSVVVGEIIHKIANLSFPFSCVGRGVLRFWEG